MHTTSRLILFCCLLFSWTDNIYSWGWSDVTNIAHQARIFLAVHVVPKSTPFIGAHATPFGTVQLPEKKADHVVDKAQGLSGRQTQNTSEIDSKLTQITELEGQLNLLLTNVAKKDAAENLLSTLKIAEKNIESYKTAVSNHLLTEDDRSLYIPKTQDLNKLAVRIRALSDTTDLSLLAHVAQAQEKIPDLFTDKADTIGSLLNPVYRRIAGNIVGSRRYVNALTVPQHGQDVVVGVLGSLTLLGAVSLSFKEPGAGMTLGSMTTGFAGAIACKRLLSQSFHKRLEDIEIRQIDTEFKSHHDRLTNLMQNLTYQVAIASIGSQVQQNARQLQEGLQAQNHQQQSNYFALSSKIDQSSHEQRLRAQKTDEQINQLSAEFMQLSQKMQEQLDKATKEVNSALQKMNKELSVSRVQVLELFHENRQALEEFQSNIASQLEESRQRDILLLLNSQRQLFMQEQSYELQVLTLHNQGFSVPQLTAKFAARRLPSEMSGQLQRFPLCESLSPKQSHSNKKVPSGLKAAGSSTESSIQMLELCDFDNDKDKSKFQKQIKKIVTDTK